uniref:Mitogen-activated protein kinase kinase kinase A n=1 Tax=Lygus hesperus TaxID=30085 RepID=A0A0A9VTM8_LYGHE
MEFIPGGSLDTLITSFGALSLSAVRRYLRDILSGLNYLHVMKIVHCDVKPHNVLLAMDGLCKLSDFGCALPVVRNKVIYIEDIGELRGTPSYLSPEVARGEVPSTKSDIFSLGVAVLEMITGKLP